jgi:plastocyanin
VAEGRFRLRIGGRGGAGGRRGSAGGRLSRRLLIASLLGVALSAAGVAVTLAATPTIEATDSTAGWMPNSATVNAGESVNFKNSSTSVPHGVHWEAGNPEVPNCGAGVPVESSGTNWNGSCTFTKAGTYLFKCTVHANMTGTITVSGPAAPAVTTGTGTPTSDTEATLHGTINPEGQATTYFFKYGKTTSYGQTTTVGEAGSGSSAVSKQASVSALEPATSYHFRIVAINESGTSEGSDQTFTTFGPPAATTSPATAIGGKKATLAGSVNPRGHLTTYYFKYGTTTAYGQETTHKTASGTTSANLSEPVTGLTPETTYHFQLVAESESGPSMGADQQFTTFGKPLVTTGQASGITDVAATLAGSVNAQAQETTYHFRYGTTEAYGQETAANSAGKGTSSASVSAAVTGLAPQTTYHFQLVAENESGTTSGTDHTFTTEATPPPPPPPPPLAELPTPPIATPPAPDTRITVRPPAKTRDRTPTVKFKATISGATYQCSVDSKPFKTCRSPFTAPSLKPGRHRIRVKAAAGGVADPTPATCSFKVVAAKKP